jgi:NodT family efflux transporter outer membrane factor (OMF) lipoprotein
MIAYKKLHEGERVKRVLSYITIALLLSACSTSVSQIKTPTLPKSYNNSSKSLSSLDKSWLRELHDPKLLHLVQHAIENNRQLKQLYYEIKVKEQDLIASQSLFFPSIELGVQSSKRGTFKDKSTTSTSTLSSTLAYEIDIWGKLSNSAKISNMQLLQAKANYQEAKEQLIADVTKLYYEIAKANHLLALYQKQLKVAQNNHALILQRYQRGIGKALDASLAKNSLFTRKNSILAIQSTKIQAIYKLENMLGSYPKGKLNIKASLPRLGVYRRVGIPSQIIQTKPSIAANWSALLAQNYRLALAHKERLPSLSISASLEKILSGSSDWSLLGGIVAPLFNAGKLKANEKAAYYELQKAELAYLQSIYTALVEIESYRAEAKNLQKEYRTLQGYLGNIKASLRLAKGQYLQGQVEYTTLLELQESLYTQEAAVIAKKEEIITNRINLYKALGGGFIQKRR